MLAIPLLVGGEAREAEVGAQVDDACAAIAERRDGRCGGGMRVCHDGRIDGREGVDVELFNLKRHAVAGIELLQAPAHLRAAGDRDKLEARVTPEQMRGERAGEPRRPCHEHPRRARGAGLNRGGARARERLNQPRSSPPSSPRASTIRARTGAISSSVSVRSAE